MTILTIDGSGEVSHPGTLKPGLRHIFSFATNGAILAGTLGFREISPEGSPIDFFAEIGGTTPVSWDLAAVASGRMEFTASAGAFLIYVTGSTPVETLEYAVTPVS